MGCGVIRPLLPVPPSLSGLTPGVPWRPLRAELVRGTQQAAHAVQRSLLGVQLFPGISLQWGVKVGGGQQVLVEPQLPWR